MGVAQGRGDKKCLWQGPWWGGQGLLWVVCFRARFLGFFFLFSVKCSDWSVVQRVCACVSKAGTVKKSWHFKGVQSLCVSKCRIWMHTWKGSAFSQDVLVSPRCQWQSHDGIIDTVIRREWPEGHLQYSLTAGWTPTVQHVLTSHHHLNLFQDWSSSLQKLRATPPS